MSNKIQKVKLPLIKNPIAKKISTFVGGNGAYSSAKVIPNKDAYKRM